MSLCVICSELLNDLIEEHQETFDDSNIRDFIDAFLLEMKKEDKHNSFTVSAH